MPRAGGDHFGGSPARGSPMLIKGRLQWLMNSRQQTTRTTAGRAFSTTKSSVPEETGIAPTGCLRKKASFKANGVNFSLACSRGAPIRSAALSGSVMLL
jgi:hypothetical protein